MVKNGDQNSAMNNIKVIMDDPARTPEQKTMYQTIYTNAQIYYNTYMQNKAYTPTTNESTTGQYGINTSS